MNTVSGACSQRVWATGCREGGVCMSHLVIQWGKKLQGASCTSHSEYYRTKCKEAKPDKTHRPWYQGLYVTPDIKTRLQAGSLIGRQNRAVWDQKCHMCYLSQRQQEVLGGSRSKQQNRKSVPSRNCWFVLKSWFLVTRGLRPGQRVCLTPKSMQELTHPQNPGWT